MVWLKKREDEQYERSKRLVMLLISLPREQKQEDERRDYREILAVAEPFVASINAIFKKGLFYKLLGQEHITLEISAHSGEIFFYVGVPVYLQELIERQVHAQYPTAQIEETDDYSIFKQEAGHIAAARLGLRNKFIFPIRTFKEIELDPINAVTNVLSKMPEGASACIQYLVRPRDERWRFATIRASKLVQKGKSPHMSKLQHVLWSLTESTKKKEQEQTNMWNNRLTPMQEGYLKKFEEKATKLGFDTEVKWIVVAPTQQEAEMQSKNIFSAFEQFNNPETNGFVYKEDDAKKLVAGYIFRTFAAKPMILNTEEIGSVWHFPNRNVDTPNIHWLRARKLPPPPNLPEEGTVIGVSVYRGEEKLVMIKPKDRMRHVYEIGKTGVGKTVLLQNMILQDITEGKGVCYIDPNGDAIEYVLNHLPKNRADDVILFEPSDILRPMGMNLLEWHRPEEKDFLIQEAISIFYKLFDPGRTGIVGPQFEHWMRNAALTVMAHPDGGTLIDIPRLFMDKEYENELVSYVEDPMVISFWKQQMAKTSDYHKSEMLNYFTSKFGRFMTNTMMRNIIGQSKSAFNLREVMDNGKILLVNLSKGLLGEMNANLLGMIVTTKIQMAAFSRQDQEEEKRVPFYFYVDEFQNFTTDAFATILSEARKYKLSLTVANQYISQLPENIRDAVMGNAGTLVCWRIGAMDAEFMVKEFEPLIIEDLVNVDQYNFYTKLLIDNAPSRPFNCRSISPTAGNAPEVGEAVRQLSRLKYGRDAQIVDWEIKERTRVDQILTTTGEADKTPIPAALMK